MQTNYGSSDQAVEHVERIEDEAASDLHTQRLSLPDQSGIVPVPYHRNRNNTAAIALIVIGVLIALSRIFPEAVKSQQA